MEFKETIASFSQILQEFQVPPKMGVFSVQQWKCPASRGRLTPTPCGRRRR